MDSIRKLKIDQRERDKTTKVLKRKKECRQGGRQVEEGSF